MVPRHDSSFRLCRVFFERVMDINSLLFMTLFFFILYIIIFIFNYLSNKRKIKKRKKDKIGEMNYLISKFNLDNKKIDYKKEILYISLINSFIISLVGTFISCLNLPMFIQLAIGFILLLALIYSLYEIYGRHLAKKLKER